MRRVVRTRVHDLVDEQAALDGARPALTSRGLGVDYAWLSRNSHALGRGLRLMGVVEGDRVAVYLDKRLETVTSLLAASVADAAFVPVNPVLKVLQVTHVLSDCDVRVLVTSRRRWDTLAAAVATLPALEHVVLVPDLESTRDPAVTGVPPDGSPPISLDSALSSTLDSTLDSTVVRAESDLRVHRYTEVLAAGAAASPVERPGRVDHDIAAILYTSGSTGPPKGVVLSHRNLVAGAESVASYLDNDADDVLLALLPLSFDAGLSQLTTGFSVGAHVVLATYLGAADVVRLCAQHGVTGLTCVPPLWIQIVDATWPDDARRLRYFANTGGRMPAATLARLRALFPAAAPFLMYGLTEAFRSTYLDPAEVDARPGSIGRAVPNAEILVLRPDGSRCEPGEPGELVHRGPLVAQGYWNDPERTVQRFRLLPGPDWALPERAVWSGDTVVADADGYLSFVGRHDDMIKTSGYRVSPTEIEEAAYETGLVRDAVALGVEDATIGQRIVLVVSGGDARTVDTGELVKALRRRLPLYMVPAEVLALDDLPRSPNGKFDRVRIATQTTSEVLT